MHQRTFDFPLINEALWHITSDVFRVVLPQYTVFLLYAYFASLPSPVANFLYYLQMIYWTDSYEISARQTPIMKS